ncbi:MAG: ribonuclease R family protein, partial [Oscillospiraceae bacterium]
MKEEYIIKTIINFLSNNSDNGVFIKELEKCCNVKKQHFKKFNSILKSLEKANRVYISNGKVYLFDKEIINLATITKISNSYGFAELEDKKFYIPGRLLKGSMVGDICLIRPIKGNGDTPEGEVVKIVEHVNKSFTGTFVQMNIGYGVVPDNMSSFTFKIKFGLEKGAKVGEKISCSLFKLGESHFKHIAQVLKVFGDSNKASVCSSAIIDEHNIKKRFDKETLENARQIFLKGITLEDLENRLDLRKDNIFTIDSHESKDLDDALSVKKEGDKYILGVHIADVSHYIKSKTDLDNEAFLRGTSVYYADNVIPMLPKEISNGICSLSCGEDRLCFSCFMTIDNTGSLLSFEFKKTVINSKVKGVYKEINGFINNDCSLDIKQKYDFLKDEIYILKEITHILIDKRAKKGSLEISTSESKIVLDSNKDPIDILARKRGFSERIVEECMVLANEACATFARQLDIPFIYRVHEKLSAKKVVDLTQFLSSIGFSNKDLAEGNVTQYALGGILNKAKDTNFERAVHINVLRSMATAKYEVEPKGHYGLALDNYSHFTSPIRRYPDLAIH